MQDPRRVSDEMLLALIRERLHDSEIAVRLGITTGQLRERKAELRNRLGAERYQALTGTARRRQMSGRTRMFLWGAAVAAGCFAILLGVANIFAGDPGDDDAATARAQPAIPTRAVPIPPPVVTEDGRTFLNAGKFVATGSSGPVGTPFNRATMVAMELRATTFVTQSSFVAWELVSASTTDAFLRGTLADRQLDVALYTQRPGGRLRTVPAGVGPLLEIEADAGFPIPPTIMLVVRQGSRPVEARLRADGTLLIAPDSLASDSVFDADTGHLLDVSRATAFGSLSSLPGTRAENGCNGSPPAPHPKAGTVACRVSWQSRGGGFSVPFDGTYSCTGARSLRYEGGGVRLEFILTGQSTATFACQPTSVRAGQPIIPSGEWILAATIDGVGEVTIVATLEGDLFVGEVRGEASCPCLPRES